MTVPDPLTHACDPAAPDTGLRLGRERERRLRAWPTERIRPKSVGLGVLSLLAEVDALRAERDQDRRLRGQCDAALVLSDEERDLILTLRREQAKRDGLAPGGEGEE